MTVPTTAASRVQVMSLGPMLSTRPVLLHGPAIIIDTRKIDSTLVEMPWGGFVSVALQVSWQCREGDTVECGVSQRIDPGAPWVDVKDACSCSGLGVLGCPTREGSIIVTVSRRLTHSLALSVIRRRTPPQNTEDVLDQWKDSLEGSGEHLKAWAVFSGV